METPTARWLTAKQAAEVIGVHKDDIYKFIKNEGLPARKVTDRRYRICEKELHEWMASRELAG